jgi:hypothetical protein
LDPAYLEGLLRREKLIERVHEHLLGELTTNTRTDTIFVITAILLNLVTLGVNSAVASSDSSNVQTVVMFTFAALTVIVNLVAEIGLIRGRQSRAKIINGLMKMYKDQGVDGYYDPTLLGDYSIRYNLFIIAVLFTGIVALIVPFVLFFL